MHGFINHKFTRTQNLAFVCTFTFRMKRSFINETPGLVLLVDVVSASSSVHAVNVYLLIVILNFFFLSFSVLQTCRPKCGEIRSKGQLVSCKCKMN